jgi:exodeoxyribonuclease-3
MKIITWNCNMAFRKKAGLILTYKPDIVVVPECEHPDKLKFGVDIPQPTDKLWFGSNLNKGLGIFSYSQYRFKLHKTHNPDLKMVIPVSVTGGDVKLMLYAIWANNPNDPDGQYVEQVWKAIHHYDKHIKNKQTILVGDFNSNTIWDRKYRIGNHSHVVKRLEEKGVYSCYHLHHQQLQGKEAHPTYYLYRHKDKPYHLDYCFVSADMAEKISSVEIGDHEFWSKYSDHVPVMVTLD